MTERVLPREKTMNTRPFATIREFITACHLENSSPTVNLVVTDTQVDEHKSVHVDVFCYNPRRPEVIYTAQGNFAAETGAAYQEALFSRLFTDLGFKVVIGRLDAQTIADYQSLYNRLTKI